MTAPTKPYRILIADDHAVVRMGLRALLASQPGIEVCGEATSGVEAVEYVKRDKPDLVLLDFGMPGINGIETAEWMFTADPDVPIILFTVWDLEGLERAAAEAGICAVVRKTKAWTLIDSIETLFAHKSNHLIQ